MAAKFCPSCGATEGDFYRGFCIGCYLKTHSFIDAPAKLAITRCRRCGRWLVKNRWVEDSFRNLAGIAGEKVRTSLYAPRVDADIDGERLKVSVAGYIDPKRLVKASQEARIALEFRDRTCDSCAKFAGKYFEVKIQLRRAEAFDPQRFREADGFVRNRVRDLGRKDERARAFWSEENRDGVDFFFGFRQVGDQVYGALLDAFRAEHEASTQFLGFNKEGKKKVRFTYCVRV